MENEFAKKIGRETFEKLSQETQSVILECFDHQKWIDTEQAKLDYIYSLAQLHPVYSKYQNGMAEKAEQKIQRAFQTLVLEGNPDANINPVGERKGLGGQRTNQSNGKSNGKSSSSSNDNGNGSLSLEEDLELSLEGL
ncbi:MAG: hypothetical protein F6K16_38575 [Symploca sp. SIO2B6]|nr:hypothetical protein [Symploca sp. SIO2B6]